MNFQLFSFSLLHVFTNIIVNIYLKVYDYLKAFEAMYKK